MKLFVVFLMLAGRLGAICNSPCTPSPTKTRTPTVVYTATPTQVYSRTFTPTHTTTQTQSWTFSPTTSPTTSPTPTWTKTITATNTPNFTTSETRTQTPTTSPTPTRTPTRTTSPTRTNTQTTSPTPTSSTTPTATPTTSPTFTLTPLPTPRVTPLFRWDGEVNVGPGLTPTPAPFVEYGFHPLDLVLTANGNSQVQSITAGNAGIVPPSGAVWLGFWDTNNISSNFLNLPTALNLSSIKGAITLYTNLELNGGQCYIDLFDHDKCTAVDCNTEGWVYIYIKSGSGKVRVDYSTDSIGNSAFLESSTSLWNLTGTHRIQFDWRKAPNRTRLQIDNVVEDSHLDTVYFVQNGVSADDSIPAQNCEIGGFGGGTTGYEIIRVDDARIYGVENP